MVGPEDAGDAREDMVTRILRDGEPREPVEEMQLLPTVHHPIAGKTQMVGLPVVFHGSPASIRKPSPAHGQHTEEILRQVGYSDAKIQALQSTGAVQQWQPA